MDLFSGMVSLLPLLVAVVLIMLTGNSVVGLFAAAFSGALALNGWRLADSAHWFVENTLYAPLRDPYLGAVLVFVVFYCGFVGTTENTGSITGLSKFMLGKAKGQKSLQLFAFLSGAAVFFSDLGAPMVVGHVFRPAFDERKISREKLAFLINCSAPPVCAMVPIVGWGLVAMSDMALPFAHNGIAPFVSEWTTFISSIYYFIFPLLMIVTPFLTIFSSKSFAALAAAENRVAKTGAVYGAGESSAEKPSSMGQVEGRARVFVISTGVLCLSFVWQLLAFEPGTLAGLHIMTAMCISFVLGGLTLLSMLKACGVMPFKEALGIYCKCFYTRTVTVTALMIVSWAFGLVSLKLGADKTLFFLLNTVLPVFLLPAAVFALSAALSYAIGSAWSTYGIVIPFAVSFAVMGGVSLPLMLGAAISGAVFGDFSSPRSHSPGLAARSAWCDIKALSRVQKPYALTAGFVSLAAFAAAPFFNGAIVLLASAAVLTGVHYVAAKTTNRNKYHKGVVQ